MTGVILVYSRNAGMVQAGIVIFLEWPNGYNITTDTSKSAFIGVNPRPAESIRRPLRIDDGDPGNWLAWVAWYNRGWSNLLEEFCGGKL
jgi:hypothetical protein